MILRVSTEVFTFVHVLLSLVGIGSGLIVILGCSPANGSTAGREERGRLDDQRLDEALEMTFPASDPVAVSRTDQVESHPLSGEDLPPTALGQGSSLRSSAR